MDSVKRKEIRYSLQGYDLKGELILYPDPRVNLIRIDDMSATGAGITILSEIDAETEKELQSLAKASREGNRIPVQLIFNGTKIPVSLQNALGPAKYGICVCENEKLAVLAEKGKQLFRAVVQAATKKGAEEMHFIEYPILGREFLPNSLRIYLESRMFTTLFGVILANELANYYPQLTDALQAREDTLAVEKLFMEFMEERGRDVILILGTELFFMKRRGQRLPLDAMVPVALRTLCSGDKLFSGEGERKDFERYLHEEFLKKRLPTNFRALPPNHPTMEMIRSRFNAVSGKIFFLQALCPHVCDYYLKSHLSPDSELAILLGENERLAKTTLHRWVQNVMNEMAEGKEKGSSGTIEDLFRQAMYEYMVRKKNTAITPEEIYELLDGKIQEQYRDVRNRFLAGVCRMIEPQVAERFQTYKADTEEDRAKEEKERKETLRIQRMVPVELMKRFVWPKLLEFGHVAALQKEIGRSWITKEQYLNFAELGGVVVLARPGYEEFVDFALGATGKDERPEDLFEELDLQRLYQRIFEADGVRRKDKFAIYLDTLMPPSTRALVLEKVIQSPVWSRYYVLNRTRNSFTKMFREKGEEFAEIIERNMLSAAPIGEYV